MAAVYIIYSQKLSKFYIGSCNNIEQRLSDHRNKTYSHSYTSGAEDWELYFIINNLEGTTARKIEQHIKSMKSRKYLENLKTYPEMAGKLIFKFNS